MEYENIYNTISEILNNVKGNYNILEEQIDIDLQTEYFEYSKNYSGAKSEQEILETRNNIFEKDIDEEEKKNLFIELASLESIIAYRTIEKYLKKPETNFMKDWATLAFQESRMLIESKLLDENQIFISTGLGGKNGKLRYFIVFLSKKKTFSKLEKKVIKDELLFRFKKNNSELEELNFSKKYTSILAVVPLNVSVKKLFEDIIDECNQFGDFINKDFIITNVRKLSFEEVESHLSAN